MESFDGKPFPAHFESQVVDTFARSAAATWPTGAAGPLGGTVEEDRKLGGRWDKGVKDRHLVNMEQSVIG